MSQFYALMSDNTVKHISLKEEIVTEIKNLSSTYKCNFLGADNKQ